MIKLIDNELQIDPADREIGATGDNAFDIRTFSVPRVLDGHNLDEFTFILLLTSDSRNVFEDYLRKEIMDDTILLTWVVREHDLAFNGKLEVSLKFYDSDCVKQSKINHFLVNRGLPLENLIRNSDQSVFDQAVAEAAKQAENAKAEADRAVGAADLVLGMYDEVKQMYNELKGGGANAGL